MTTGRINQVTTFTVARSKPQATVTKHVAASSKPRDRSLKAEAKAVPRAVLATRVR